jgi:xylulokinase
MDYLMGIDLGSTSLKAVIYDLQGRKIAAGSRPTERFHPSEEHPEWTVWQPENIWQQTAAAIRDAVGQISSPEWIRAVAVTGMGMDGVPIDEDGNWLYPFISWHDPRTLPQLKWWQTHVGAEKQFSIGGNPLWPINSALRILWMAEHEPELLRRTDKWLLIEDFLNFMLCGRRATDYSMASCTLLFDQRKLGWSDELIELSGIDRRLLCDAFPSGTLLGEIHEQAARLTELPVGTPVVLGGHDHLCGALPVGAFRPGVVLDVTGTWEIVMTPTAEPVLNDQLRVTGTTVQAHVAKQRYAVWGGNVAGEMLEWYRRQLTGCDDQQADVALGWDELMAEAASAEAGANGVMFLPHISGATCPVVDPASLGTFVGLSPRATRGDMLRAIVEGLDYQFLDIVLAMSSALGREFDKFVAVGGATQNAMWMQNKADVVGKPIDVVEVEEATPLGAAILAGIGVGKYADVDEAYQQIDQQKTTFEPDVELAQKYTKWFHTYRELYPTVKDISHRQFEEFMT